MNHYEEMERLAYDALLTLRSLGFTEANDAEFPADIWHPGIRESLSLNKLRSQHDPLALAAIIKAVYERGRENGRAELQRELRTKLGL